MTTQFTYTWDIPGQGQITTVTDAWGNEIAYLPNSQSNNFVNSVTDEIYMKWHDAFGPDSTPVPSRIVAYGFGIMLAFQQFSGLAIPLGVSAWKDSPTYPEDGTFFAKNAQCVDQVNVLLQQATAASWQGLSANAYHTANAACVKLAQAVSHSDRTMERLVRNQAECVTQTQLGLGVEQDALILIYIIALYLEANPATFDMALLLAVSAVSSGLATGVALLSNCVSESSNNASAAHKVDYHGIARAAQRLITDALPRR